MIRRAQTSEIQKIMDITKACALKMSSEGIYQWNDDYPNMEAFELDLSRDELYVILVGAKVVGCITISTLKDVEYNSIEWLTPDRKNIYVHRLAIHPNFQGRGYAQLLMDFAEEMALTKEAASIRLDTFSKNSRNQRFYEKRGYHRLGEIYFPKQSAFPFYCYEKSFPLSSQ